MVQPNLTNLLYDAVALWELAPKSGATEVIDVATRALIEGVDFPALCELAGASPMDSYWTLRPLIENALDALGSTYPGPTAAEVQVAATRVMCRRLTAGAISPRELARWAHRTIGHEGANRLQDLVDLDDAYEELPDTGTTVDELDAATRHEAATILTAQLP